MQESWKNLIACVKTLFKCRLIPEHMLEAEDFLTGKVLLFNEKNGKKSQPKDTSLFSSLSSFLYSPEPEVVVETEEEQHAQKKAFDCVQNCRLSDLFDDSRFAQDSFQQSITQEKHTQPCSLHLQIPDFCRRNPCLTSCGR